MKFLSRVIGSSLIAICILSIIFTFYELSPIRVNNQFQNTDYVFEKNSLWIKNSEGNAYGRFDEWGFNNKKTITNPDILILGSSHMEAVNVKQNENTAYFLSEFLNQKSNENISVYNMGISGHSIDKVLQYLPNSLAIYNETPKTIIIETSSTELDDNLVKKIINGNVPKTKVYDKGIIGSLQKNPFIKRCYRQLTNGLLDKLLPTEKKEPAERKEFVPEMEAYQKLFSYVADLKNKYKTNIVIFYHPTGELQDDGSVIFNHGAGYDSFKKSSESHGITFVDMTEPFEKMYAEKHYLPHGFITGEIETGHINKHGHKVIAEELYKTLNTKKEDK